LLRFYAAFLVTAPHLRNIFSNRLVELLAYRSLRQPGWGPHPPERVDSLKTTKRDYKPDKPKLFSVLDVSDPFAILPGLGSPNTFHRDRRVLRSDLPSDPFLFMVWSSLRTLLMPRPFFFLLIAHFALSQGGTNGSLAESRIFSSGAVLPRSSVLPTISFLSPRTTMPVFPHPLFSS